MKKMTAQDRRNKAAGARGGKAKPKQDRTVSELLAKVITKLTKKRA
jgi:hypothetical protein